MTNIENVKAHVELNQAYTTLINLAYKASDPYTVSKLRDLRRFQSEQLDRYYEANKTSHVTGQKI